MKFVFHPPPKKKKKKNLKCEFDQEISGLIEPRNVRIYTDIISYIYICVYVCIYLFKYYSFIYSWHASNHLCIHSFMYAYAGNQPVNIEYLWAYPNKKKDYAIFRLEKRGLTCRTVGSTCFVWWS